MPDPIPVTACWVRYVSIQSNHLSCFGTVLKKRYSFICMSLKASGILKGFDQLLNLVLDGTTEYLRG